MIELPVPFGKYDYCICKPLVLLSTLYDFLTLARTARYMHQYYLVKLARHLSTPHGSEIQKFHLQAPTNKFDHDFKVKLLVGLNYAGQ